MASDSDSEGAAMAAAMGFSSFGGRPAAKKRKFNPTTDAFVEGQALEKLDRGGKKGTGSGGNMIPLGKARVIGKQNEGESVVENREEIMLDDEEEDDMDERQGNGGTDEMPEGDDGNFGNITMVRGDDIESSEDEGEGPQYIDTSQAPPAVEEDGPQYSGDTRPLSSRDSAYTESNDPAPVVSESVTDAEAQEMQRRIDAILQSIGSAPPPPNNYIDPPVVPPGISLHSVPAHMLPPPPPPSNVLPNRAAPAFGGGSRGGYGNGRRGGRASGGGGRNEKWYVEYYDPGFNVNPWEALEKERGLEPVGTWLEYPKNQGRGGQRA